MEITVTQTYKQTGIETDRDFLFPISSYSMVLITQVCDEIFSLKNLTCIEENARHF